MFPLNIIEMQLLIAAVLFVLGCLSVILGVCSRMSQRDPRCVHPNFPRI
jgi:hypothetical protein